MTRFSATASGEFTNVRPSGEPKRGLLVTATSSVPGSSTCPSPGSTCSLSTAPARSFRSRSRGTAAATSATVHLQLSQAWRAYDASGGEPPDWRLFALLGAGSKNPTEQVLQPGEVMNLIAGCGLQVRSGWPAPRPGRFGSFGDSDGPERRWEP